MCERIAFKLVESGLKEDDHTVISVDKLDDYIGQAKYQSKRIYDRMRPGVVIGLAYNSRGGSILYIESRRANNLEKKDSIGNLKVTG